VKTRRRIYTADFIAISYCSIADQVKQISKSMSDLVAEMSIYMKKVIISKEERDRKPELVKSTEGHF
jgi:hypothetical protein